MKPKVAVPVLVLGTAWVLAATGCSEETSEGTTTDPEFAVGLTVFGTDLAEQSTTFVAFVDSLETGEVDLRNALEVGSAGGVWGVTGSGEFYVTNGEDLTLVKYRAEDGQLAQVGRVGLSREIDSPLLGIPNAEFLVFDGPSRGFLIVPQSGVVVELDLDAMEIVGSLDAAALRDPVLPTFLGFGVFRDGIYVFPTVATDQVRETVSELSQLVFFDPSTGTFEARESPCGGLGVTMLADNNDLYFSTDPWIASIHALDETRAPTPCVVRVPAGSRDPDPNVISLNDVTGEPTGGLVPRGDTSVYVRALDTTAFPVSPELLAVQLFGSPAWTTWEVDLARPEEARRVERALVAGGISIFEVDGVFYENESALDFSSTTLVRTTGTDSPAPALTSPGVPFAVLRLR